MAGDKKTLKFQMMMSPEEAKVLDDWMFTNRVRSRAEAIRRLCQIGLNTEGLADDLYEKAIHVLEGQDNVLHSFDHNESDGITLVNDASELWEAVSDAYERVVDIAVAAQEVVIPAWRFRNSDEIDAALERVKEDRLRLSATREDYADYLPQNRQKK